MKSSIQGAIVTSLIFLLLLWFQERRRLEPIPIPASMPKATSTSDAAAKIDQVDKVIIMATDDAEYIGWSTNYLSKCVRVCLPFWIIV